MAGTGADNCLSCALNSSLSKCLSEALRGTVLVFADVCSLLAQLWLSLEPLFPPGDAEPHPAVVALLP